MRYQWELLPKLASEIEHARRNEALRDLDALLRNFCETHDKLDARKMRCAQSMSACLRAARRGGAPSAVIFEEHVTFLDKLCALRNWPAAARLVRRYTLRLIELVEPSQRSPSERLVAGIIKDLKASLHDPRTLAQYAGELDLSTGHLSRTFAEVAGRPFRDELRRLRIEAAQRLLEKTDLKIEAIARRVGLRSTSQFIADFRRQTGVTPAQFRRH